MSRETILQSIRRHLPESSPLPMLDGPWINYPDPTAQFISVLEMIGGKAGYRDFALDQFGPLTKTLLNTWGIRRCSDFGDIVFNLIEYNVFSKTESDRREDFADIYDFDEAFVKPFQPAGTRRSRGAAGES